MFVITFDHCNAYCEINVIISLFIISYLQFIY